jgi:hypothetical protein
MTQTCATCPFARHLDGDRYVCSAEHNQHSQVVRGHWETTTDCESALAQADTADADYVMQIEAGLEKADSRATEQEQFSQVVAATPLGIEIDSIKFDSYRIWSGSALLGTMHRTSAGWLARPIDGAKSWHCSPNPAQQAVIAATIDLPEPEVQSLKAPDVQPKKVYYETTSIQIWNLNHCDYVPLGLDKFLVVNADTREILAIRQCYQNAKEIRSSLLH